MYLRKEYTHVLPSAVVQQICSRAPWQIIGSKEYAWLNIWDGLFGIFPGTASSNNSLEARHADWQQELESLGGRAPLQSAFERLEALYRKWADTDKWLSKTLYSPVPSVFDTNLLHGSALEHCGRAPALSFAKSSNMVALTISRDARTSVVAMERVPQHGLDRLAAEAGAQALQLGGAPLIDHLVSMGVLRMTRIPGDADTFLAGLRLPLLQKATRPSLLTEDSMYTTSLSAYAKYFQDIVYVVVQTSPGGQVQRWCSCSACLRYFACEHMLFTEAMDLPGAPASRNFSELPENRRRGRPPVKQRRG